MQASGYDAAIGTIGGVLASTMFLLFAVASIAPACICAFVAANSFSTMIPGVPRMSSTMAAPAGRALTLRRAAAVVPHGSSGLLG